MQFFFRWVSMLLFSLAVSTLTAQSPSYHLEFTRVASSAGHDVTRITLVNDSEKPIEAFRLVQRYEGDGAIGGSVQIFDILEFSFSSVSSVHAADGTVLRDATYGIGTGDRWDVGFVNGKSQVKVDAVLFANGSHEGDEAAVRSRKANRDGLRDGVNYWVSRIDQGNSGASFPSDAAVMATRDRDRQHEVKRDVTKFMSDPLSEDVFPPLYTYWGGRRAVDSDVQRFKPDQLVQELTGWKKKIDNDRALKALDAVFPPVSAPDAANNEKLESHPADDGKQDSQ